MRQVSKTKFLQDNRSAQGGSCYPDDWFLERAGIPKVDMVDSLIVPRIELESVDVIAMPTRSKRVRVDEKGEVVKDSNGKEILDIIPDPITWNLIVAEHMLFTQPTYTQLKMGSTMTSVLSRLEALSDGMSYRFYKSFILLRGTPEDKTLSMPVYHNVYLAAISSYHFKGETEPANDLVRRADVYMELFMRLLPELDALTSGGVHCTHKLQDGSQSSPEETSSASGTTSTTD